eukprot:349715-Chlamydomonas_euryale.AAC.13
MGGRLCRVKLLLQCPVILRSACHSPAVHVQLIRPVALSEEMMQTFHTKEYVNFLKHVTPENQVWAGWLPGEVWGGLLWM